MISKKLLSMVLSISRESISVPKVFDYHEITYRRDGKDRYINIYELAFLTRDYLKKHSRHLTLNQNIEDIFKEANNIYEDIMKQKEV